MNIGIILPEIGGFSSVSLEFNKWHRVMPDLGHKIFIITGKSRSFFNNVTVMSDIFPENDFNMNFSSKLLELTDEDTADINDFEQLAYRIEAIIHNWVDTNQLDLLIVENYFSIPINLPVSYALYILFQKVSIKKIVKHHDAFYRNNVEKLSPSIFIKKVMLSCFPIDGENILHISSNRLIKSYLKEKCHVDSIIIPYVINFKESLTLSNSPLSNLNDTFEIQLSDKILMNFSDLLPSTGFDQILQLLENIQDDSFKIISVVREHRDYLDYYDYLTQKIEHLNLSSRIILIKEESLLTKDFVNIDYLFTFAKGILCLDHGVGFGQPLHMGIRHKCPLLFCTQSQLDWLELSDLGCKLVNISDKLNAQDIVLINRHINMDVDWGEVNYGLMKQYYSMSFLQYLVNGVLMRV